MDTILAAMRAAAETTRLRVLALCTAGDLTVTEITQILGQSQPRVSRHLKVMCEAGLLDRFREGAWVFYRVAQEGPGAALAQSLLSLLPPADPVLRLDRERLEAIKRERSSRAAIYFRDNALQWHSIRSLHVDEREVERRLVGALVSGGAIGDLLDIGTGTGRMLEIMAPHVQRGIGIDESREMLAVARHNLERAGLRHCLVRHGDMYQLPLANDSVDAVTIHQVLHYAENPQVVVAEAARVLRPGGRLAVVDFAPHGLEDLRSEHNHRRLGFSDLEVEGWCRGAGLDPEPAIHLSGHPLTVVIWLAARRPGLALGPRAITHSGVPAW
ncbi:MAG: metalloregulator ArsR/SmtB family transcription factor [Rhodospirillales bacterium]|nr:metalloregulator ArsR/SmtB family transcription factor [Rhodospirillales bacterium]